MAVVMAGEERSRAWRVCDTCGELSLCPVWVGVSCNHIVSQGRGMETCSGHYYVPADDGLEPLPASLARTWGNTETMEGRMMSEGGEARNHEARIEELMAERNMWREAAEKNAAALDAVRRPPQGEDHEDDRCPECGVAPSPPMHNVNCSRQGEDHEDTYQRLVAAGFSPKTADEMMTAPRPSLQNEDHEAGINERSPMDTMTIRLTLDPQGEPAPELPDIAMHVQKHLEGSTVLRDGSYVVAVIERVEVLD